MKVIENAEISWLNSKTRKFLQEIIQNCQPSQLLRAKQRRFVSPLRDDVMEELNTFVQVNVVQHSDSNYFHVICTGTGFKEGASISRMSGQFAWKALSTRKK